MEFLYKYGKKPDMIVGDFDSVDPADIRGVSKMDGIEWKVLRPEKRRYGYRVSSADCGRA